MTVKKTYQLLTVFDGPLDEVLGSNETAKVTIDNITDSLKEMAFMLETVAHLQGRESAILPITDKARALIAELAGNDQAAPAQVSTKIPVAKATTYDSYSDPGHSWLKVKRSELDRLGITAEITGYSYQRGEYAYLEEDCDLSLFMYTKEKLGEKVAMNHHNANICSRIRSYDRFKA